MLLNALITISQYNTLNDTSNGLFVYQHEIMQTNQKIISSIKDQDQTYDQKEID
jgi:hypothetical protein